MESLDNTLIITPRSRFRELVNRIEELKRSSEKIVIDMTPFDTVDPANIGAIQVFELVLFSDYVCKRLIPYETLATNHFTIDDVILPHRNFILRHLSRYGLFDESNLYNRRKMKVPILSEPDTVSGSHILLRLTQINPKTNVLDLAQDVSMKFQNWALPNKKLEDFTNSVQRALVILTNNLVYHSGIEFGEGDGLLVVQADRFFDGEIRYRIVLAIGDLGIGLRLGLEYSHKENHSSDLEALRSYIQKPTMSKFICNVTNKWDGHIQIHSREAMISMGKGGYSFIEGRYPRTPGLQVISLIEMKVDEN